MVFCQESILEEKLISHQNADTYTTLKTTLKKEMLS